MGGRIGRVGVVDVDDELETLDVDFVSVCTDIVDGGVPNGCPGEKAGVMGLSTDAEV